MQRTLPVLLFLCCCSLLSRAQHKPTTFSNSTYIKANVTTLINELDIYIEQELTEKLSVELGVTGIYTDYPDYILAKKIDFGQKKPDISTEQFVEGRGLGFRAGLRWYIFSIYEGASRAGGTYFQPVLFYKKIFYPNEDVEINDAMYKESASKNVYGLQFLLGRQFTRGKIVFDPYLGLGIRSKVYHYTNFNNNSGTVQKDDGRLVSVLPSLQLGIKLGLKM
ncbi:hypothetical protein [Chitinophaga japonensis]|uniref:DUF3575 domain-containing protein n=1 Tax=Chitinophaga japonensis TaxID=104662 RepID=A0A562TE01_CHIJA|nr:hypothetical protein [Chitinophaga japonensis]TWI91508.1 hypothetical protein LX66_0877 [Chitinophaga japonensis]